jgi:general secretion pathway protein J
MGPRIHSRSGARGMTLLEILVSLAILAMISLLLYGAFDSMSRGKRGEALRADRARQGREAVLRITRELQSAFLSMHNPQVPALQTRVTAFVGTNGAPFDRIDFQAFAHTRVEKEAKESDQAEVGYFVAQDPSVDHEKNDLVRREQTQPSQSTENFPFNPKKGGVINVVAEDVELFDVRYLDPMTGLWVESWDTTQTMAQPNRLPLEVKITLTLKGVPNGQPSTFTTKQMIPMTQPLSFGIPR